VAAGIIPLKDVVDNFLAESGVTVEDILDAMDEEKGGIMEALAERVWLDERLARYLESRYASRQLNYLLFVLQTFYIVNMGGVYKGSLIIPLRDSVVKGDKVTPEGLQLVLRALGMYVPP